MAWDPSIYSKRATWFNAGGVSTGEVVLAANPARSLTVLINDGNSIKALVSDSNLGTFMGLRAVGGMTVIYGGAAIYAKAASSTAGDICGYWI